MRRNIIKKVFGNPFVKRMLSYLPAIVIGGLVAGLMNTAPTAMTFILAIILCILATLIIALYHEFARQRAELNGIYGMIERLSDATDDNFQNLSHATAEEIEKMGSHFETDISELASIVMRIERGEDN